MKILVTGATGFVGREIVSELIKNKYQVYSVASLKSAGKYQTESSDSKIFYADITDSRSFTELKNIGEINVLIHSAGLAHQFGETKKEEFDAVNVEGAANAASLAIDLRAKHFILIGSTAVYGVEPKKTISTPSVENTGAKIDEETEVFPQTLYAQSKLEAEYACRKICEANDLPLTIFRLAPVIGEANVGNVARLIESIRRKRFLWIGSGENVKSLIYKNDVARACVSLIEKKNGATEIFNLAAPPVKMKNFVNEIADHLNVRIPRFSVPATFIRGVFQINAKYLRNKKIGKLNETVEKWLSDDVYAADKIADRYGFRPQTPISEAIRRQIAYTGPENL